MRCDALKCQYNDGIGYCLHDSYVTVDVNGVCDSFYVPGDNTLFDRDTALAVLKDISAELYPSYDLFGNKTLVIKREKFENIRKKYLDREESET